MRSKGALTKVIGMAQKGPAAITCAVVKSVVGVVVFEEDVRISDLPISYLQKETASHKKVSTASERGTRKVPYIWVSRPSMVLRHQHRDPAAI